METIPSAIADLLDALIGEFKAILQANLVGVYLHGSLAMGCFNPRGSDIDFLVIVHAKLDAATKQRIIDLILTLSEHAPAKGFEFSVVLLEHLRHFVYPTAFELHYSEAWKERYQAHEVDFEQQRTDPDLAAHFVITRARGMCLYGQPIDLVFPEVPAESYLASIMGDAESIFENLTQNPVYSVLNLCRVLAYKTDGLIVSKVEGGEWGIKHLDQQYVPLITQALNAYQSDDISDEVWSISALEALATYVRKLLE